MDSKSFIDTISAKTSMDAKTAETMAAALAKIFTESAESMSTISLPSFGSFVPVKHDEEIRVDLSTGKKIMFPPHIDLEFHPASSLRKKLTESHEQ